MFVGSQGLRAGWGMLIWFLLAGVVAASAALILMSLKIGSAALHGDPETALGSSPFEMLAALAFAVATVGMMLIERRPAGAYGVGLKGLMPRLAHGLATGLGLMALLVGALVVLGGLKIDAVLLHGGEARRQALLWGVAFIAVGVSEELLFRGYLMATLARGIGFRWAAIISSVLFGLTHISNHGEGVVGIVAVVLIGLVFAYSVWKTGSLWWAIGFHIAWDWAESFLFGVGDSGFQAKGVLLATHAIGPDWLSGGATGPEGSVVVLLTTAMAAALIRWTAPAAPADGVGRT